jgi:hypothetical protein
MTWLRSLQPGSRMHRLNPLGLYNILEKTFCLGFQSLSRFLGPRGFTLLQASLGPRTKEQSAAKYFNTSLEGKQLTRTRKYTRGNQHQAIDTSILQALILCGINAERMRQVAGA